MATASSTISGLASGLDTATIVSQLMQLEAAPQTRLKTRMADQQSLSTTLQSLNSALAALTTKAQDLAKASAWSSMSASSTATGITLSSTTGAAATQLGVTVTGVARSHQLGFTNVAALTDTVTGASTKVVLNRFDGTPLELETGDGTLTGLVNAINLPGNATGLHASTIKTTGGYKLLVESTETGVTQDFDLTALDGSALLGGATVRAGADASVDLGAGITVTSSTNTFTDLMPGVTLTLAADTAIGATASVGLTRNVTGISDQVSALVDAVNGVLASIDNGSKYDSATKKSGKLQGDADISALRSKLLTTVYGTGETMADLGVQTTRDGTLVFDKAAFAKAYAADPAAVESRFTTASNGFAERVAAVGKGASDSVSGTLTNKISGTKSIIDTMQDTIDAWDLRLELRRTTLNRQFSALETAMSQMQAQSNWLSSQVTALSSSSSSS